MRAGVQAPADGDRGGRQPQDDIQHGAALCGMHQDPLGGEPDGQGGHRRECASACSALCLLEESIRHPCCMHSGLADTDALLAAPLCLCRQSGLDGTGAALQSSAELRFPKVCIIRSCWTGTSAVIPCQLRLQAVLCLVFYKQRPSYAALACISGRASSSFQPWRLQCGPQTACRAWRALHMSTAVSSNAVLHL